MTIMDEVLHKSALFEEHQHFGAQFKNYGSFQLVEAYDLDSSFIRETSILLCDYSCLGMLSLVGEHAQELADNLIYSSRRAKLKAQLEDMGIAISPGVILTAEKMVSDLVLQANMTPDQQLIYCNYENKEELLEGLRQLLQESQVQVYDETANLTSLIMLGKKAVLDTVVGDYLNKKAGETLPADFELAQYLFDGSIPTIVSSVPLGGMHLYILQLPAPYAPKLWRSLLSFNQIQPTSIEDLHAEIARELPCFSRLFEDEYHSVDELGLTELAGLS